MTDIQQDKCDIAMFGVGITQARAEYIDYSEPYLSSGMYGVASKANPALDSWEAMDQPVLSSVYKKAPIWKVSCAKFKACRTHDRHQTQSARN